MPDANNIDYLRLFIQVGILTIFYYLLLRILRGTNGIIILFTSLMVILLLGAAGTLGKMEVLGWLSDKFKTVAPVLILIVFQNEIRRYLLFLGSHRLKVFKRLMSEQKRQANISLIDELIDCVSAMTTNKAWHQTWLESTTGRNIHHSTNNMGLLIAIATPESSGLKEYIDTGVRIDAPVNNLLLQTIFYKGSPLHDGGVIIQGQTIVAAGCIFPLSQNHPENISAHSRHLAAKGMAETSRALVLLVSEESGAVAVFEPDGHFRSLETPTEMRKYLLHELNEAEDIEDNESDNTTGFWSIFRRKAAGIIDKTRK